MTSFTANRVSDSPSNSFVPSTSELFKLSRWVSPLERAYEEAAGSPMQKPDRASMEQVLAATEVVTDDQVTSTLCRSYSR